MGFGGRAWGAVVVTTAVVAMLLTGCDPQAKVEDASADPDRVAEIGALLGENGIAVVPFEGGDPRYPVEGEAVLRLTDWQLLSIVQATPVALQDEDEPTEYGGVVTSAFRDTTAALPAVADPDAAGLTPDRVVFAWWIYADSPRAKAARELMGGRSLSLIETIPLAVLTFFVADALGQAGFEAEARAEGDAQVYAMDAAGVAASDPCAVISNAISDVNAFLDGMGTVGTVIRFALGAAADGLDALTGEVLTMVKRAIAVANMVLSTATLLTPWKVSMSHAPTALSVGFDQPGVPGTLKVTLDGVVAKPPAAVQSCLSLVGVIDPSSQLGSLVTWHSWDGFVGALPSSVVPGSHEDALDADNTARWPFTTGTQTLDPTKKYVDATDGSPSMTAIIERADVATLTSYIRSLGGPALDLVLGDRLETIANAIELAANPDATTHHIPVAYRLETGEADPAAPPVDPGAPPGAAPPPVPEIWDCVSVGTVEWLTGFTVVSLDYGPFGEAAAGQEPPMACRYTTSTGGTVATVEKVAAYDETGAVSAGFIGILNEGECDVAAGYLPAAGDILGYYVWTGRALKGAFYYQLGEDDHGALQALAQAAAFCTH